ncbi:J domain-containing protein [Luteimonas terrae]|uniref:J domain-containing protein n=1 Tax=Luteimonas terrae TaxID=1530191 RepID=A0ABU1XUV4_9GAMM|nr:J domain-containing protein [Luteimonas terrae]MDR7192005.1 hypothetical protein [Luteimonas terrae]
MSWALDWLQLPHDADERTIKRAYAGRLKTTRPDTDPDGFQQLHEAYQAALAWSRHRDAFAYVEDTDDDAGGHDDAPAPSEDDIPDGAYRTVLTLDELLAATGAPSTAMPLQDIDGADLRDADDHDARAPNPPAADTRPAHAEPPLPHEDPAADLEIDIDALCAAIIEQACASHERSLLAWLHQRHELWSLQVKPRVGAYLIATLHAQVPPIGRDAFNALLDFFGLDQVGAGHDAYALQVLGERMQLAWELVPGRADVLARRTTATTNERVTERDVRRMLDVLRSPYNVWAALFRSVVPKETSRFRAFLQTLGYGLHPLPDDIDRDQVAFWSQVSDTQRMTRPRAYAALMRCAVYGAALTLLAVLLSVLVEWLSNGRRSLGLEALDVFAASSLGLAALWWARIGFQIYLRWQGAPEGAATFAPRVRLLWVPILAVSALIVLHAFGAKDPGTLLAVAAAFTALARFLRRRPGTTRFHGGVIAGAFLFLKAMMTTVPTGEFAVASALFLWTIDLWLHRRDVRWRR